jgi:hypothetical protein
MSFEMGPPDYTQQELAGNKLRQEEDNIKNAKPNAFGFGLFFFAAIGLALTLTFPKLFGGFFNILEWSFTLAIWSVIIYFSYFILKKFKPGPPSSQDSDMPDIF